VTSRAQRAQRRDAVADRLDLGEGRSALGAAVSAVVRVVAQRGQDEDLLPLGVELLGQLVGDLAALTAWR
jgi:hypothetical protein